MRVKATNSASPTIIPISQTNNTSIISSSNNKPINPAKKHHKPAQLIKEIFKEIGYFTYDIFLLATESSEKLAKIAKNNKFLKPAFMLVEGLCLVVNIKDKIEHAKKEGCSKLKTIIEVVGEAISGIVFGLLIPDKIIQMTQNLFKAKKPLAKTLTGALGLVLLEALMLISGKLTNILAKWIDEKFSKKPSPINISAQKA